MNSASASGAVASRGKLDERGRRDARHLAVVVEAEAGEAGDLEAMRGEIVRHRPAGLDRVGRQDADPSARRAPSGRARRPVGGVTTGTPGLAAWIAASISASPMTTEAEVQE